MLTKGCTFNDFYYAFDDGDSPLWNPLKAFDFQHAVKSVYSRTPRFERSRRVRLCSGDFDSPEYDGPVSGLKSYFKE